MAVKKVGKNERNRLAKIVALVLSAMRNIRNEDGCTISKIIDYITDIGCQFAPKQEVITALKRSVEFGIMKKRGGRYFLKYKSNNISTRNKRLERRTIKRRKPEVWVSFDQSKERKDRRKKRRRRELVKTRRDRRKTRRQAATDQLAKCRRSWGPTKNNKFFELYVNPCCRVSAKSSVASTQMLVQEETENSV